MGLRDDWSTMKTVVNNMVAAGNTNQGLGLQVGWMSLAVGGPFTVPTPPAAVRGTRQRMKRPRTRANVSTTDGGLFEPTWQPARRGQSGRARPAT